MYIHIFDVKRNNVSRKISFMVGSLVVLYTVHIFAISFNYCDRFHFDRFMTQMNTI